MELKTLIEPFRIKSVEPIRYGLLEVFFPSPDFRQVPPPDSAKKYSMMW